MNGLDVKRVNPCLNCKVRSIPTGYLKNDELDQLGTGCYEVIFAKGELLFKQDAISTSVIYIREGLVKVHIKGPEREQILKIAKGPSYLGIPNALGDKKNNYSASSITEVKACLIDQKVFKDLLASNSDFSFGIIMELCNYEIKNFRKCVNRSQKQSAGRISEALLFFSEEIFNSSEFLLPINRSEFGDFTANSRENVSRIFSNLEKDGIIKMSGKKMKIINSNKLEEISRKG